MGHTVLWLQLRMSGGVHAQLGKSIWNKKKNHLGTSVLALKLFGEQLSPNTCSDKGIIHFKPTVEYQINNGIPKTKNSDKCLILFISFFKY